MRKKILFICGSLNQTMMMHKISLYLDKHDCYFTPYYADGIINQLSNTKLLSGTILGGKFRASTLEYLNRHELKLDLQGKENNYDLVLTCSDLIIPKNIRGKSIVLVQEGMTDPENFAYHPVKQLKLPRWIASTSTTGLSHAYSKFCVASEGYKKHFAKKGVDPEKIVVTGIPNFDNCEKYYKNNFPHKNFVLVATSDSRETFKFENRQKFIEEAVAIAAGRKLIFKLHPNENFDRAVWEINNYAPGALIYTQGEIGEMIANCDVLITRYSTVVYIGLALNNEVYSEFSMDELKELLPIQNNGLSASNIATEVEELLKTEKNTKIFILPNYNSGRLNFLQRFRLRQNLPVETV